MTDVFISYSRKDQPFVRCLHDALQEQGRSAWVDWEGIPPSAEWLKEIYGAIEAADTVVFVISAGSVVSKICAEEIEHAVLHNKRIVPVLREEVEAGALPKAVQDRNWIYLREVDDFAAGFTAVMKAIDTDLDWLRAHTRLLTRAIEWDDNGRDYGFALHGSDLRRAEQGLTTHDEKEPRLTPLQIEYILASRRDANKRRTWAVGLAGLALTAVLVFGLLFWLKRLENNLNVAADFREKGISELAGNNPLAAEVLFAYALTLNDSMDTRQLLVRARARSARLLWINRRRDQSAILAMSLDGAFYASSVGKDVELWDINTRRSVREFHSGINIDAAALSPDKRLLALAGENRIELWAIDSRAAEPARILENAAGVLSLAFNAVGGLLVAGKSDGMFSAWKLQDNSLPVAVRAHTDKVTSVAVSADGGVIVSGSWDNTVKLWDTVTGKEKAVLVGHDDAVLSVAFSPNGELVASGGWDNMIWLWDVATGKKLRALEGHNGGILTLAFSPDGKWLASGSEDRTAKLWEVETGRQMLTLPGHENDVSSVAFVGHRLATGDVNGVVRLWDTDSIGQRDELITLRGHERPVSTVAFNPRQPLLASGSWDKTIRLSDLRTPAMVTLLRGHEDAITALKFSPSGLLLASASKDTSVRLWTIETGASRTLIDPDVDKRAKVRDIAFSPDGGLLASGSDDGNIRIWNTADGRLSVIFPAHEGKVQGVAFSPDGKLLASSGEDAKIALWRVGDWNNPRKLSGHQKAVWQVAFSPDGRLLLSGSDDRTARLWDVESGTEVVKPLEHDGSVWSVDFNADGTMIATGCADSTVQIWDVVAGRKGARLDNHATFRISDGPVWWIAFNRDRGDILLGIGSKDRTARVFNVSQFRTMFADTAKIRSQAERESGLRVQKNKPEPHVAPIPEREFVPVADREPASAAPALAMPSFHARLQARQVPLQFSTPFTIGHFFFGAGEGCFAAAAGGLGGCAVTAGGPGGDCGRRRRFRRRSSMLRRTPGLRRIRPARSRARIIWWTEGGLTRK